MERAHVIVRLKNKNLSPSSAMGICRTSATTVRLEHSARSPDVTSLTFEQVFDVDDSNMHVFQTSLTEAVDSVIAGKVVTVISTGTRSSGKSFACHGDQPKTSKNRAEPGLITLAIRRIFSTLEVHRKNREMYKVQVSCWGVRRSGSSNNELVTDLLALETRSNVNLEKNIEKVLLERAVVVETCAEAIHLYSKALGSVKDAENQDFLFALHVETRLPSGEERRGRILVADIHVGSSIEPRGKESTNNKEDGQQNVVDPQFPVHEVLDASFASFVGQSSSMYLLVTIQTPAQFQQRAIQLLLYACKAKKDTIPIDNSSTFGERRCPIHHLETQVRLMKNTGCQIAGCHEDCVAPEAPFYQALSAIRSHAALFTMPPASPPLSATSSGSTYKLPFLTRSSQQQESHNVSQSFSPSTSCASDDSQKELTVSTQVRKAYELAKAATSLTRKKCAASGSISSDAVVSDAAADELLKHDVSMDTWQSLTLQAKLGRFRATQVDPERALVHEDFIKDQSVDQFLRLSQNMSCQVAEHEQQLHEALTAKHVAEVQLYNLRIEYGDVEREVVRLQEEIEALKAGRQVLIDNGDAQSSDIERARLRTLPARLEEAMIPVKDVITFKDGVIQSLEERLQLASKRGADAVTLLKEEKGQFEREKAQLVVQLQQSNEKSKNNNDNNEEVSRMHAENVAIQQQKADLTVRVAQLTVELETARLQWTREAQDREERAEQRCAEQVSRAEQQLGQATAAMQHQMAQFRDELDVRMTRQRVATQVACKAGELKNHQLERELQAMKLKLAKQKIKMKKKCRALVASARNQYEQPVGLLERKLSDQLACMNTILEREQVTLRRAKMSEEAVERWQTETQQLQALTTELERERNALKTLCKELNSDNEALKGELEHLVRKMEQSEAPQMNATETRMHKEQGVQGVQAQKIVKQHNHEISRLKAAIKEQDALKSKLIQLIQQQSSSTVSSRVCSVEDGLLVLDSSHQRSIDELDAHIDSNKRLYRRGGQRRKAGNSLQSTPSSPSTKNVSSLKRALAHKEEEVKELLARQNQLLAALATANEQETLAKEQVNESETKRQRELAQYEEVLQQLNCVKQENWNLNLALHVTEATTNSW